MEKSEDHQFEPHARIKLVQVLGSLEYICGSALYVFMKIYNKKQKCLFFFKSTVLPSVLILLAGGSVSDPSLLMLLPSDEAIINMQLNEWLAEMNFLSAVEYKNTIKSYVGYRYSVIK